MSYLFWVFLSGLVFLTLLLAYIFNYLRSKSNNSHEGQPKEQYGSKDLREMAKLLNSGGTENARLVIGQLSGRKLKGRETADLLALRMRACFKLKEHNNSLNSALQLSRQPSYGRFCSEIELIKHLAFNYAILGHNEKSYNEYILLVQKCPQNIEYLYGAANQALKMRQYETAISLFQKVLQRNANHGASLCKLGRIFYEKKLYTQALDYLNRAYYCNYDSNELRYYLALNLMQTSGRDMAALTLLSRVSKDPTWAKRALPRLVKLSQKMGNYPKVVAAIDEYRNLFAKESGKNFLNELTLLQASAYRHMHHLDKACNLWAQIPCDSLHYAEAQEQFLLFKEFVEPGIFYDYIHAKPQDFVKLCTKVCDFSIMAEGPKRQFFLEGHRLKLISGGDDSPASIAAEQSEAGHLQVGTSRYDKEPTIMGALVLQRFQERRDSSRDKINKLAPILHFYLRLDQSFREEDLQYNLYTLGIDFEKDYERVINIHIYAFHRVSPATFPHRNNINIMVHQPKEFQEELLNFGHKQPSTAATPNKENTNSNTHLLENSKQQAQEKLDQAANSAGFQPMSPIQVSSQNH